MAGNVGRRYPEASMCVCSYIHTRLQDVYAQVGGERGEFRVAKSRLVSVFRRVPGHHIAEFAVEVGSHLRWRLRV